jgi:hypothetical protein
MEAAIDPLPPASNHSFAPLRIVSASAVQLVIRHQIHTHLFHASPFRYVLEPQVEVACQFWTDKLQVGGC